MTTKITSANIDTTSVATATSANTANFNIALLGFKMAITEGLTVFNLIDGIVDEFEDESGTDGSASTNLLYNSTDDYYINSSTPDGLSSPAGGISSAGFSTTTVTEPDTSTAGTNPALGSGTAGEYTVPSGVTSLNAFVFGSGGGGGDHNGPGSAAEVVGGGGGGFSTGNISVTPGQVFDIRVGEGGAGGLSPANQTRSFGGGGAMFPGACNPKAAGSGGGFSGIFSNSTPITNGPGTPTGITPQIYIIAGSGGGGGGHLSGVSTAFNNNVATDGSFMYGGSGGGLTGKAGGINFSQTSFTTAGSTPQSPLGPIPATRDHKNGGGGSQTVGGDGAPGSVSSGNPGGFLYGGNVGPGDVNIAAGGSGYYGGGAGGYGANAPAPVPQQGNRGGGGGSSYYGNPALSSTSTSAGDGIGEGGGVSNPNYSPGTNEGVQATPVTGANGEDGYVLLLNSSVCASTTSSTIISDPFTANTVPTTTRIVVFEENVGSPTLNTDIIASVSRNGGTNFTTVTLTDSGYVTGSSGQRILTGQASVSGQPSGQSMKWKLELANQTVKIHGVSLQWS